MGAAWERSLTFLSIPLEPSKVIAPMPPHSLTTTASDTTDATTTATSTAETKTSTAPCPIKSPADYDFVYRRFRPFLHGVVYHSGVPSDQVDDATAEIMVRMIAQDGLAKYTEPIADTRQLRAYLATYFSLAARAEVTRIRKQASRHTSMDELLHELPGPDDELWDIPDDIAGTPQAKRELIDVLRDLLTGDAREFVDLADQELNYDHTRRRLVEEGWGSLRIRRAVSEARKTVRSFVWGNTR